MLLQEANPNAFWQEGFIKSIWINLLDGKKIYTVFGVKSHLAFVATEHLLTTLQANYEDVNVQQCMVAVNATNRFYKSKEIMLSK